MGSGEGREGTERGAAHRSYDMVGVSAFGALL